MAVKVNFTSMFAGVGKTTLIVQVARQLQSEGYRILIVDNSYKVSRLPIMFGLPSMDRSLNEVIPLTKMAQFNYTVLKTYINVVDDTIDAIGCSRRDIMDSITMEKMIDLIDFYGDYDYIFIESPARLQLKQIDNIFVVDGRISDYKMLTEAGNKAIINKYDSYSGVSAKKAGKGAIVFPYEPTMVSYEMLGKYNFSSDTFEALEELITLISGHVEETAEEEPEPNQTAPAKKASKMKMKRGFK